MRIILLISILLTSCSGYKFQQRKNPFKDYNIKSINIPMFYNKSNFSNINSHVTKEVFKVLQGFKGLEVRSGGKKADATLVGIVYSSRKMSESMKNVGLRAAKSATNATLAESRDDFFIPTSSRLHLSVQIYLIKNPSAKEIKLMHSSLGKFLVNSRVIINEKIKVSDQFLREVFEVDVSNVTGTQNRGAKKSTLEQMAIEVARSFKDNILYVF